MRGKPKEADISLNLVEAADVDTMDYYMLSELENKEKSPNSDISIISNGIGLLN